MKKSNLENKIKDSFDNHEFKLNHDEIWENIEPELKKKKKKRFFFIWFFGGAMMLAFLFMYTFNKEENLSVAQESAIESESVPPALDAAPFQVQEKEVISPIEANKVLAKTIAAVSEKYSPVVETIDKIKAAGSRAIDNSNILESNNLFRPTSSSSTSAIKREIAKPVTQEQSLGNVLENTIRNSAKGEVVIVKEFTDKLENEDSDMASENITDNNFADSNEANNLSDVEETDKVERLKSKLTPDKKSKSVSKKRKSKKRKKKKVKRENDTDEKSKKVRTRHSRRKATYYAQPTLSYIVPLSSLSSRGSEVPRNLQIRQDSEKRLEAFGIGLNFYRQSRNGFIIVSGIEYQRINTSVNFSSITEEVEIIQGIVSITENALGQVIDQQSGTKVITKTTIEEQRIFNHHTFINVPVGIGRVWKNRKYDVKVLGGLDFNVYHNFNGTIKDVNRDFNFSSRNSPVFENVFKKKTGVGLWLSSEFAKPISKKALLWVAPRIQIPFSDVNSERYNLKQKYFNVNVSVGVSLKLL